MIPINEVHNIKNSLHKINKNQSNEVIFKIKDYDRYETIKLDEFNTPQEALTFVLNELSSKHLKYIDIRNIRTNTVIDYGVYNAHYLVTNCEFKAKE